MNIKKRFLTFMVFSAILVTGCTGEPITGEVQDDIDLTKIQRPGTQDDPQSVDLGKVQRPGTGDQ